MLVECSGEVGSRGNGSLFFNTAHLHTHVLSFDDHHHSLGVECFLYAVLYVCRKTFLHLETVGENVDDAANLAQASDIAVRDIAHMGFP